MLGSAASARRDRASAPAPPGRPSGPRRGWRRSPRRRARRADRQPRSPRRPRASRPARRRSTGDDGQARDAPHRLDRVDELVEVEEGLDHEQVGTSPFEQLAACSANASRRTRVVATSPSGPIEPAMKTSSPVTPGVARELDGGRVDPLELVVEVVRDELASVGAEAVGLDQLGNSALMKPTWSETRLRPARAGSPSGSAAAAPPPRSARPCRRPPRAAGRCAGGRGSGSRIGHLDGDRAKRGRRQALARHDWPRAGSRPPSRPSGVR